jgi:hypothetical protein
VVDAAGRCVGLIDTPGISAGFRSAGGLAEPAAAPGAPAPPRVADG